MERDLILTPYYVEYTGNVIPIDYIVPNNNDNNDKLGYHLYCLESWIHYYLSKYMSGSSFPKKQIKMIIKSQSEKDPDSEVYEDVDYTECEIIFSTIEDKDGNGRIVVNIYYDNNMCIIPSDHVNIINTFINDDVDQLKYLLLMPNDVQIVDYDNKRIPNKWIFSILKYLDYNLPWNLNQYGLCFDLSNIVDYIGTSQNLYINIQEQLRVLYKEGYIVNPSENLILNWDLITDDGVLYKPERVDYRLLTDIKSISALLIAVESGKNYYDYYISSSMIIKHLISKKLGGIVTFTISEEYIRISTEMLSYDKLVNIFDTIDDIISEPYDKITLEVLPLRSLEDLKDIKMDQYSSVYKTENIDRPFILSVIKPVSVPKLKKEIMPKEIMPKEMMPKEIMAKEIMPKEMIPTPRLNILKGTIS